MHTQPPNPNVGDPPPHPHPHMASLISAPPPPFTFCPDVMPPSDGLTSQVAHYGSYDYHNMQQAAYGQEVTPHGDSSPSNDPYGQVGYNQYSQVSPADGEAKHTHLCLDTVTLYSQYNCIKYSMFIELIRLDSTSLITNLGNYTD